MQFRLRPLDHGELGEFIERNRTDYVEGLVAHARMPRDFAIVKAEKDLASLTDAASIPDGHSFYWIEADGDRVGRLWFEERQSARVGRFAWLYDIEIDEPFRGRGYGRRALELLEEDLRVRGIPEIALNVWGGNEAARGLYRSGGYFERAVEMVKELQ